MTGVVFAALQATGVDIASAVPKVASSLVAIVLFVLLFTVSVYLASRVRRSS
jgi:hypothetical protein